MVVPSPFHPPFFPSHLPFLSLPAFNHIVAWRQGSRGRGGRSSFCSPGTHRHHSTNQSTHMLSHWDSPVTLRSVTNDLEDKTDGRFVIKQKIMFFWVMKKNKNGDWEWIYIWFEQDSINSVTTFFCTSCG